MTAYEIPTTGPTSPNPNAIDYTNPERWLPASVRAHGTPDDYGRVWPFAVTIQEVAGGRGITYRNQSLAGAEQSADNASKRGAYRVSVHVDTCG